MPETLDIEAAWSLPDVVGPSGIALYLRREGGAWKRLRDYLGTEGTPVIEDLEVGVEYEVAAAAIDDEGNIAPEKDWAIEKITPEGPQSGPPTPANFSVGQNENQLEASWDSVKETTPDLSYYELRVGSSWADARLVRRVFETFHRWYWEASGSTTFRLAAVDRFGRRSAETTFTIDVRPLDQFTDGTLQNEDGGSWAGTKTDTEVDSGNLRYKRWGNPANTATEVANTATWLPWGPAYGEYETSEQDLGSARRVRLEIDLDWSTDGDLADRVAADVNVPAKLRTHDDDGALLDPTADEVMAVGDMVAGGDETPPKVEIFIKHDTSTPISGSYARYVPGFYYCRYYRLKLRLWSWNRWRRVILSKFRCQERKKNLKEEGQVAVAGSPGPTTINFSEPFIDTPRLVAITDTAGYTVRLVSITSASATVRVYDDAGSEVFTGNIDWIAAGT